MSSELAAAAAPAAPEVVPASEAVPAEPATGTNPSAPAAETAAPVAEPTKVEAKPVSEVDGPEPHSPLLDKLSAQDKATIKSLRAKLPEILTSAYSDTPKPYRSSTTLWGVTLDPAVPPSAKEYIVLYKFLKARNMNVDAAGEMLLATLRWREEMNIDAILKEEFPHDVFGALGRIYGYDKEGRPVTYNLYGEVKDNKAVFGDVKRFIRWRVQLMEKGLALLDFETIDQMVQVHGQSIRSCVFPP